MNKHIFGYMAFALGALLFTACNNESEADLLETKVYFPEQEHQVTLDGQPTLNIEISARLSKVHSDDVEVSYELGDTSLISDFNAKGATKHMALNAENVKLEVSKAKIVKGDLSADKVMLSLSNLDKLKEGTSYVIPIKLSSSNMPVIEGNNIEYIVISNPIRITKVGEFRRSNITVMFPASAYLKSFTYEALVYATGWYENTIMGCEGFSIFRVGDIGGGIAAGVAQIAGKIKYEAPEKLQSKQWYHLAVTYDVSSGKTVMYKNGVKWAEQQSDFQGFSPNADYGFQIGMLVGFPWGDRPFYGYMSEVRVWSVARSENDIKQHMLGVDPKSEGLELYYKLDGTDKTEGNEIYDKAKGIRGEMRANSINIATLPEPINIK
ncbi:DUF1735 and LamG domain-containing protein [Prevotella sp. S7 MS 2]|uniref:DUF1735 and LamG domain-containing protein n=1 Tax=Prevotella sp. S7 MS 2 TaxID=1287488 RepID=UPI0005141DDA|nr:DUF1735 and LamG domain-containing protein [Prevotella sp. S7 MS 2]KGI61225.1 hypothetical protein HMPREF0671_01185 [Prevotella sp. S7 MS 2]